MTKNIIVVDEHGKKYGTTYLKRAKGLVKQGRARFLAQNMLCLACPPEHNSEDNNMSEQTIENMGTEKENSTQENIITNSAGADDHTTESKYSVEYCLEQIEQIGHRTEYLNQVLADLRQLESGSSCGEKALALGNIVESREKTNQQMLRFYEKMYDDLKTPAAVDAVSQKARLQEQLLKIMGKTLENSEFSPNEITDMFNGAFDAIRHIDN